MRIVHVDEVPIEERKSGGREGTWERRRVMQGDIDSLGNFSLVIYYHNGSFYSPRHHHNFDQFRYQLDGTADFDRNGKMTPGVLGYFPEGAYYGPTSGPPHTVAVLQFGGPSGSGYMGGRSRGAADEMQKLGSFEKGVFRRNPEVTGPRNQDSYEAIWEYVNKRKLVYPEPQYGAPIMIDSNNVPWTPVEGAQGVEEKFLGIFTHTRLRAARYRLAAGAGLTVADRGIYVILSGDGSIDGDAVRTQSVIYLDEGERATFTAGSDLEILLMGMSAVSRMASAPAIEHAEATL
jgi:hypothetical protein